MPENPPSAPAAATPEAPAAPAPAAIPASSIPAPIESAPAKPGSAKSRLFSNIGKYADGKPKPEPKAAEKPAAAPAPEPNEGGEPPEATPEPKPGDKPAAATDPKKKANPWELYNQSKTEVKNLQTKLAELEAKVMKPEQQKEWESKQARLKELEEEIRYTNYQKSEEFKTKYQQPYDAAWKRAMSDLGELKMTDNEGNERDMSAEDLLDVVNLPLKEARQKAVEKFGDFADDAMQHRKEIRRLYDEQAAAIATARTEGAAREQKKVEEQKQAFKSVCSEVQEVWNTANEAAKADDKYGKFFQPKEGDQEWNQRLAKGTELADRAFSENPAFAKTSDERRSIVQRHAAVRNRAAAFGALVHSNNRLESQLTDLKAKLARYEGAEPPASGSSPKKEGQQPARGWAGFHKAMEDAASK